MIKYIALIALTVIPQVAIAHATPPPNEIRVTACYGSAPQRACDNPAIGATVIMESVQDVYVPELRSDFSAAVAVSPGGIAVIKDAPYGYYTIKVCNVAGVCSRAVNVVPGGVIKIDLAVEVPVLPDRVYLPMVAGSAK